MEGRSVILDYRAAYHDPIEIAPGEAVVLTGRTDRWDGHLWLWAVASSGKEGWIPDDLVALNGGRAITKRCFAAKELSCATGDTLLVMEETHGWAFGRIAGGNGEEGWIPIRHLGPRFEY